MKHGSVSFSFISNVLKIASADMIQFLVWFTSNDVQTRPTCRLVHTALITTATAGCTDQCLTIIYSGLVSDKDIELAFQTACEHGHLDTAQYITQCGRINKQQMRNVLDAYSSIGSNKAVVNWLMCSGN